MMAQKLLLFGLVASFWLLSDAARPCDTAIEYIDQFSGCYSTGTQIFLSSLQVNALYSGFSEDVRAQIATGSGLTGSDSNGIQACGEGIEEIRTCVTQAFASCPSSFQSTVDTSVNDFRGRYCELSGSTWQFTSVAKEFFAKIGQAFLRLFSDSASNFETPCLSSVLSSDTVGQNGTCFNEAIGTEVSLYMATTPYADAKERMASAYEGFIRCLYQEIKKAGCTDDVGLGYLGYMVIYGTPPGIDFSIEDFNEIIKTEVKPTGSERISSIVFGDPHIISFNGKNFLFSTCSKEGSVIYMKNTFVIIEGVNTAVSGFQGNLPPTFMTEVTVKFLDSDGTQLLSYSFTGGASLPSTFVGGQSNFDGGSGADGGRNGATVTMNEQGVARIHYKRGGVVVSIKKISSTLAMIVRMEKSLYTDSTGYLVTGCPGQEINITAQATARRRRGTPSQVCTNLGLVDDYLDACEYDIEATGDDSTVTGQYQSINEMETAAEELDDAIIVIETTTQSSACVLGHVTNMALILIGCIIFFL